MTDSSHSSRPENGGDTRTAKGDHAYFSLWLTGLEKFYEERDRRYEDRFKASDERTVLALTSAEKAISKAETATEKRFDAVNEFRGTLSDQAANLLPRAEAATRFTGYDEKLEDLKKEVQSLRESRSESAGGKSQSKDDRTTGFAIAGVLGTVVGVVLDFVLRRPS